jgi:single-stranded DNA-binding protein
MPKLGEAKFTIYGKLLAVPRLEQQGEFRWATMDMEVVTRNNNTKEEKTQVMQVKATMYNADNICKYGQRDAFYHISGNVKSKEWKDKNGVTKYFTELEATQILGGK